jgi:hypothetical protein
MTIDSERQRDRHLVLRRRDRADPQRLARSPPCGQQPGIARAHRAFADDHAIVDEKAARIAIAEITAD